MKKIKCIKCGLRFKNRNDHDDKEIGHLINRALCFNCRYIWKVIGLILDSFPSKLNRRVSIHLDGVSIKKI